jgi:hypothetical protein
MAARPACRCLQLSRLVHLLPLRHEVSGRTARGHAAGYDIAGEAHGFCRNLSPATVLQESHDISEPLQMKLEKLPYVERAFVHCDYRCDAIDKEHS